MNSSRGLHCVFIVTWILLRGRHTVDTQCRHNHSKLVWPHIPGGDQVILSNSPSLHKRLNAVFRQSYQTGVKLTQTIVESFLIRFRVAKCKKLYSGLYQWCLGFCWLHKPAMQIAQPIHKLVANSRSLDEE